MCHRNWPFEKEINVTSVKFKIYIFNMKFEKEPYSCLIVDHQHFYPCRTLDFDPTYT